MKCKKCKKCEYLIYITKNSTFCKMLGYSESPYISLFARRYVCPCYEPKNKKES